MKKQNLKLSMLILAFVGLMLTSCQNEEVITDIVAAKEIDLESTKTQAEIEQISDESSAIIEEVFLMKEFPETKRKAENRYLPDCATITVALVQNMKTVTIDFGEGCELRNGNFVSGKIITEYEKDPETATKMISFSFDGFTFNEKNIEGSGSILRERSNENGNPQSTKTGNITVTWPDGSSANKNGTKTREWIEGHGSGVWGDNVFLITGKWELTRKNGTELSAEIITPLRKELACKFLVSGVIALSKNSNKAILNYGDGECDSKAIVSVNDREDREIDLSKR